MYELALHEDAERDLDELWKVNPEAAEDIAVMLDEISNDEECLRAMLIHQRQEGRFHFARWLTLNDWGRDVRRVKAWSVEFSEKLLIPYRLIYATDHAKNIHFVLGIMERGQEYERDTAFHERTRAAYDSLGISARE